MVTKAEKILHLYIKNSSQGVEARCGGKCMLHSGNMKFREKKALAAGVGLQQCGWHGPSNRASEARIDQCQKRRLLLDIQQSEILTLESCFDLQHYI